jgi:predicted dehydrogenase
MRYLIGKEVEKTIGLSNHSGDFSDVIDEVHAIGSLSDGNTFRVSFGKAFLGSSNGLNLKIYGKNASIFWNQEYPNEFILNTNSKNKLFIDRSYSGLQVANQKRYQVFKPGHPEGFLEAFTNIYRDFDIYLDTGQKNRTNEINLFSTPNSINILETLEAIWKSNKTKKWEKVGKILKTDY